MKYITEITFCRFFYCSDSNRYKETAIHKILLPYKYTVMFCDLISKFGKLDFAQCFEDDLEFQEIIYETFEDIDDDQFEDEVEFMKENARKDLSVIRDCFEIFLDDGKRIFEKENGEKITYKQLCALSPETVKEECFVRDLTGKNPDFSIVIVDRPSNVKIFKKQNDLL